MTTSRLPVALALVLATVGILGTSCTALLAPRDDVQRCGTNEDCDVTGDNRYVAVCKVDDDNLDLDDSTDKVCVAAFKASVGCNVNTFTKPDHPYRIAFDERGGLSSYEICDPATQHGTRGCPPMSGTCNEGLQLNELGLCDDDDPNTLMAVQITTAALAGQDVRDQYCRSFFCDDRFVCNTNTQFCVLCDPERPFSEGGCGEVYIAGARSCVYDDGDQCAGASVTSEDVTFGCGL